MGDVHGLTWDCFSHWIRYSFCHCWYVLVYPMDYDNQLWMSNVSSFLSSLANQQELSRLSSCPPGNLGSWPQVIFPTRSIQTTMYKTREFHFKF